jgi:hypothetical protein
VVIVPIKLPPVVHGLRVSSVPCSGTPFGRARDWHNPGSLNPAKPGSQADSS